MINLSQTAAFYNKDNYNNNSYSKTDTVQISIDRVPTMIQHSNLQNLQIYEKWWSYSNEQEKNWDIFKHIWCLSPLST